MKTIILHIACVAVFFCACAKQKNWLESRLSELDSTEQKALLDAYQLPSLDSLPVRFGFKTMEELAKAKPIELETTLSPINIEHFKETYLSKIEGKTIYWTVVPRLPLSQYAKTTVKVIEAKGRFTVVEDDINAKDTLLKDLPADEIMDMVYLNQKDHNIYALIKSHNRQMIAYTDGTVVEVDSNEVLTSNEFLQKQQEIAVNRKKKGIKPCSSGQ